MYKELDFPTFFIMDVLGLSDVTALPEDFIFNEFQIRKIIDGNYLHLDTIIGYNDVIICVIDPT